MKLESHLHIICICLISLLITGCARNITSSGLAEGNRITNYTEELDTVRPRINWEKTEEDEVSEPMEARAFFLQDPMNENVKIVNAISEISNYNGSKVEGRGYRLQVFSGNSRTSFESAKSYILRHFPELEIYESYSQPTYRIKTGDFTNRLDAERYQASFVARFSSAKIITDRINFKNGLNLD